MYLCKSCRFSFDFRPLRALPTTIFCCSSKMCIVTNSRKGTTCIFSSPLKQWQCVSPLLEHLQAFYRVEYNFISFLLEIPLSQSQNGHDQRFILSVTKYNGNNLYCCCSPGCISQVHRMFCKVRTFVCTLGCQTDVIITSNRY